MTDPIHDRAAVLGGSMAGLLAARALADTYTDVRVIDRDDLSTDCGPRRGVPQARHIHALLPRGQQALEELFPGLTAELRAHGAPAWDMVGDARACYSGHRLKQGASGLVALSPSRALLERLVRARVRDLPQVTVTPACDVVGLATTPDRRRVCGARLLRRADGSAEEVLDAALLVDASGRGSPTPAWLEALGYDPPDTERVRIDLAYATCRYRLPPDALGGDLAALLAPTPAHPRGGALARLEDDQWMLTLFGVLGDHPPTDPAGFLEFARSLQFGDIYHAIRNDEPLDKPVGFRFPESVRRRYERLTRFPEGLVVVGDSVCSLNPIYGQGMTVAGLEALALRSHLRRQQQARPRRFHRAIARAVNAPWEMDAGGDLAFPDAQGRRTQKLRLAGAYITQLHAAAAHDTRLASAFTRVSGLLDPPQALMRPGVALRVLRHRLHPPAHRAPMPSRTAWSAPSPRREGTQEQVR